MRIGVCILHYGNPELTQRLYRQFLEADSGFAADIFVLDNNAPEPFPSPWCRLKENIYWSGAFEFAATKFTELGYTHLWFCNNDLFFISKAPYLERIYVRLKKIEKNLKSLTADFNFFSQADFIENNINSIGTYSLLAKNKVGIYSPSLVFNPYHAQMQTNSQQQYRLVTYLDGVAPVVNLNCFNELGGLDAEQNIYGYGLDIWLSWRAFLAGWALILDHQLTIKHQYHATAAKIPDFLSRAAKQEQIYLSMRLGLDYKNFIKKIQFKWQDIDKL